MSKRRKKKEKVFKSIEEFKNEYLPDDEEELEIEEDPELFGKRLAEEAIEELRKLLNIDKQEKKNEKDHRN